MRSIPCLAALVVAVTGARGAEAQLAPSREPVPAGRTSVVLELPGKTVEVIGLRRWTVPMVRDSLAKYAPGESLTSHACAAVLRYQLGFADASATTYVGWPGDTLERVVVEVVEPQDSARVRYRAAPMDTNAPYRPWADGIALVADHPRAVHGSVSMYLGWQRDKAEPIPSWAARDSASVRRYLRFLAARTSEADYAAALRLLDRSRDYRTRAVAATVLLNFVDRDRAVHTLLGAVTESDGMVKGVAASALADFAGLRPRPVRWGRAAQLVHAVLDGTSVAYASTVMRLLVATGVSPADARPFLRGGGETVLAHLGAVQPDVRDTAHRLLVALRGEDLGLDPAPWRTWIATL